MFCRFCLSGFFSTTLKLFAYLVKVVVLNGKICYTTHLDLAFNMPVKLLSINFKSDHNVIE